VIAKNQTNSRAMPRMMGFWQHRSVAELAADQGIKPLERAEDLVVDLWESSEDLEAFLTDVYHARDAGVV